MKKFPFCFILIASALIAGSQAEAGPESSGGGNIYTAHFAAVGERIDKAYQIICSSNDPANASLCASQPAFSKAIARAKVLPREFLKGPDGKPRDAGPDGQGNVLLNCPAYKQRLNDARAKDGVIQVIAHEYFIAAGAESPDSYNKSSSLVNAFKSSLIDLNQVLGTPPIEIAPPGKCALYLKMSHTIYMGGPGGHNNEYLETMYPTVIKALQEQGYRVASADKLTLEQWETLSATPGVTTGRFHITVYAKDNATRATLKLERNGLRIHSGDSGDRKIFTSGFFGMDSDGCENATEDTLEDIPECPN